MLVITPDELEEHLGHALSTVETLDNNDILTLLDCWVHAVRIENLDWYTVQGVYQGTDGYYYFCSSEDGAKGFDIYEFIKDVTLGKVTLTSISPKASVKGTSRGVPQVAVFSAAQPEPRVSIPNTPDYDEDNIATGVFDDSGDLEDFIQTKYYTLRIERTGATFEVTDEKPVTVGRSSDQDVQIVGNKNISRRHAEFTVGDDGYLYVQDTGSSNGTFVDKMQINRKTRVRPTNMVGLHNEFITVVDEGMK